MFPPSIHIVYNSKEAERITEPIVKHIPNKLYYFTAYIRSTDQRDVNIDFFQKNTSYLKERIPSLEIIRRELDYTNYIETIQELSKIIKNERKENPEAKIYINISTGSKITALASVEASKLWDCKIYYVYSTHYDPKSDGAQHKGEMIIKTPITFPINKPDEEFIKILKYIENLIDEKYRGKDVSNVKRKYIYKKHLVENLYEEGFLKLQSKHKNKRKLKSSIYMKSRKYLDPLENDLNYIEISNDKRNKKVFLSETGKEILQIFEHLI
ncbi:MAG: hypothetical protein BAJALOKI2v1_400040 [Promethearchaeota archaeon]|nr:MAG: hypothetical protein BAJALOKI2v1_400040 [Candidatus Lokiarchaeota archaeon]